MAFKCEHVYHSHETILRYVVSAYFIRVVSNILILTGDEMFGIFPESLRAFDLSEYRQIFNDMSVYLYQSLIKQAEETLQSLVVPAVLEYEGLASSGIYNQRSGSTSDPDSLPSPTEKPVDALIKEVIK